jgi:ferredoxin
LTQVKDTGGGTGYGRIEVKKQEDYHMAVRKIVTIDEERCDGCGQCVPSCAEGAIQVIDGKARLVSEVYCDGLGACLGTCPQDAITITEREAPDFDEEAAAAHVERLKHASAPSPGGCPGAAMLDLKPPRIEAAPEADASSPSRLGNWPVQLTLAPPAAPSFRNADLVLVADCVPFAYPDFHARILRGNPVVVACPKLDDAEAHIHKLAQILVAAQPASLTVVHMEVPCCLGLVRIAKAAQERSGWQIPAKQIVVGIRGSILEERELGAIRT